MLYVFGKTLICRNMEVATSFARKHGLDCITLGMVIIYKLIEIYFDKENYIIIKNKMVTKFLDAVLLLVVTLTPRDLD